MATFKRSLQYGLKLGGASAIFTMMACGGMLPINPKFLPIFMVGFAVLGLLVGFSVGFFSDLLRGNEHKEKPND